MKGKIIFSKHAWRKIKERRIQKSIIDSVLNNPKYIFYDLLSGALVSIRDIKIGRLNIALVVIFRKKGDKMKVITVYPCREIDREIKKKEGKRWVRIK